MFIFQGGVLGIGTYNELLNSGIDFAALLQRDEKEEECAKEGEIKEFSVNGKEMVTLKSRSRGDVKQFNTYLSKSYDPSGTLLENSVRESEDCDPLMDSDDKTELPKSKLYKSLHSLIGSNIDGSSEKAHTGISIVKSVDNLAHGIGSTISLDDHISVSILSCD